MSLHDRVTASSAAEPSRDGAVGGPNGSSTGRPTGLRTALALLAGTWTIALGTAAVVGAVRPGTSGTAASLGALVGLTGLALIALRLTGWRPALGAARPSAWRRPALLAWPLGLSLAPLALAPFAGGWAVPAAGTLAVLTAGYLLTGFTEEALWRGAVLRLLLAGGRSPLRAALVGSALFGASHLSNVAFRGSVAVVVAQAFGAACFGVGYAAVRLRTGALWPLMLAHALTDLLPRLTALPLIPVFVAQDVVLVGVGWWLLLGAGAGAGAESERCEGE